MGGPGCVGFLFERKGAMFVDAATTTEDALMARRSEAGAEDMKLDGPNFQITCDAAALIASRRT